MQPNPGWPPKAALIYVLMLFGLCLIASLTSGCATPTNASAPYSPVLLNAYERACLTRETQNLIQLNNELWLEQNK